jgi:aerobic C4-dicarboxylate transport protein
METPTKRGNAVPRIFKSLFFQVIVRSDWVSRSAWPIPDVALQMKPLGDGFIKLIKMLVP